MSEEPNTSVGSKQQLYCSIAMCRNYKNPYSKTELYQLPSNPLQKRKFCEILGISKSMSELATTRVCALHFRSKVLSQRVINDTTLTVTSDLKQRGTPILQPFSRSSLANTSNVTTFATVNPTTFTHPNFGYVGQPIKFFLQKAVSNTSSLIPNQGSSVLKPFSSSSSISIDKVVDNPVISLDKDSSNNADTQEQPTDAEMDLQCDEELLSQSQLNSYYSGLANFITANQIVNKIPPRVDTATISTQTDPVTILVTDRIHPQPSTTSESSPLSSTHELQSGSSDIDNEIIIIEPSPPTDAAVLKVNKPSPIERSNVLLNSVVQIPQASMPLASPSAPKHQPLLNLAPNSYQATTISPTTKPSTVTTSASSDDVSKLYYILSKKPTSSKISGTPPTIRYSVKQPPPYQSNENPQGLAPLFKQVNRYDFDSNLSSQSQPTILQKPSAANTLVTLANHANQLIQTSSGLVLTTPNGIPFQNQVGFKPNLPAHQQLQLISIPDNPNVGPLPIFSNYTATNIPDSPFQLLIQNNDQPNVLFANNFPAQGSTFSGFNSAPSTSTFPSAIENDSDKDSDLLGLCNVTTVYGNDTPPQSTTPMDRETATHGSVLDKFGIANEEDSGSTLSGFDSPYVSGSDNSQNSMGPLIVDVISATEGAKEYYIGDKMPNILLDKGKKGTVDKKKKDEKSKIYLPYLLDKRSYFVGDKITNVLFNDKAKKIGNKDTVADSTNVNKNTDAPLPTVKLNKSVFSLQASIPLITNAGSQKCTDAEALLSLKVPIERMGSDDANILRNRLRAEKYITCSVWWLVRRNYMPHVGPCSCRSHAFRINRSSKHLDGYCWQCANPTCRKEEVVRRPKFFESFPSYKLESLLLLTYHWACQTPVKDIMKEVDLDCEQILAYFQALQRVCHQVSMRKCKLGLSSACMVEAAFVKLGNFFVIGAYDRKTSYTRLEAINESDAYSSTVHIQLLQNWLDKKAVLVTDKKISDDCLRGIVKHRALSVVNQPSSKEPHILNISKYLISNLTAMFGHVNQNHLSLEDLRGLLYELQWRGKYGKSFDMSFWSIMNHLRDLNDDQEVRITAKPGDLDINSYVKKMNPVLKKNWGPAKSLKAPEEASTSVNSPLKLNPQIQSSTKSYSKTTTKPPPPKSPSSWVMVKSASELFQDVPEIPLNTNAANINSKSLLAIKIRCEDSTPPGIYKPNATSLGLQLRTEGFISDPVKWLVKRGYIRSIAPCYVCSDMSMLRVNFKYKDGCSWSCQNNDCKFENMFRRPQFFARFNDLPMAQVAAMIFHWTVQSDYNIVISDVPMESVKVSHAWRAFQVLCSSALKRDQIKVGGEGQIVEVAMVQYGRLYILGARQRSTKRTLLKCFPIEMKEQVDLVTTWLRASILHNSYVVVDSTPLFRLPKWYKVFPADTSITDRASTRMHVLNITSYLLKHVFEMFGHLRADLIRPELMQMYLDELMWRERYGKLPNLAFAKIMYEIFYHEKHSTTVLSHHHKVKELVDEESPTPVIQKEACIVLHRIPQTVLNYYKCLPIDGETSPSSKASITGESSCSEKQVSLLTGRSKDSEPPNKKMKISEGNAVRKTVGEVYASSSSESESSDEEWDSPASVEEKSSSSDNDSLDELVFEANNSILHDTESNNCEDSLVLPNDSSGITKVVPSPKTEDVTPTNNAPDTNSVQPLVIKMNKNPKKFQSYLKSEFLKAKYKKQRRRKFNIRRPRRKAPQKKLNPVVSEAGISGVVVKKEIVEEEAGPSGLCQSGNFESASGAKLVKRRSAVARRLETSGKQICIECGKEVDWDHFMKQFNCTDCTKAVYTTCCGNAFFEHRSALLFGKRPERSRRDKVSHGLHRLCTLSQSAVCPCGFKSKIGNQIASHLVICQETSCVLL